MWRWVRRLTLGIVGVLVVIAIGGAIYQWYSTRRDLADTPPPGRLVDVGGHRLHIWCKGSGTPAVIFDAGLGDTSFVWSAVQDDVATFTQACAYDRAGSDYSDAGPKPRNGLQFSEELDQLLRQIHINDPVVLVGASIGGLYVRILASQHPERAAGLVLVDASHEDQGVDMPRFASLVPAAGSLGVLRVLGISRGRNPESLPQSVRRFERAPAFRTSRYLSLYDELVHIAESASQVRASRRELTIPLVVVTSGRGNQQESWRRFQQDKVRLSQGGCQRIVDKSGHVIAHDPPEMVVNAIRATVAASKTASENPCTLLRTETSDVRTGPPA